MEQTHRQIKYGRVTVSPIVHVTQPTRTSLEVCPYGPLHDISPDNSDITVNLIGIIILNYCSFLSMGSCNIPLLHLEINEMDTYIPPRAVTEALSNQT